MGLWLLLFFVVPLLLLFLISFWRAENFQLSAVYNLKNWHDVLTIPFFRVGYYRTFLYACLATVLSVLLGFSVGIYAVIQAFVFGAPVVPASADNPFLPVI
jgi:ABC-type spermidine/putrescine transport system permease subunit I